MPEFLSYNPETGIKHSTDFDEASGTMFVHAEEDVTPLIERNKLYRTHGACDNTKNEFFRYASIPNSVVMQLRKRGLNLFTKDQSELLRIQSIIQSEYPDLLTTNKRIYIPKKGKSVPQN
jgi:hypothetical protein